ncbi:MAG: ABC transporter substrate-binding protein [Campylobacterota bacterium]
MKNILLVLLILSTTLSARNEDLEKVSLRLLWLHQFEFAGFYTALEKGYYEDAGIDLQIKEYALGTNIVDEVLTGESEFGLESSSLILDKMEGKDVFLLAAIYQKSPFVLMAKKREDLQTIDDLRGKKIMVTPNQVTMATLNAMFKINNIYHNDYISVAHTFDTDDLIEQNVDAMSTYVSNEPFHLKEKGVEYLIFDPADYGFAFYSDILFTSQEFAKNNPKLIKRFYEATLKGWEYSFENIDETVDLIYNRYNSQNKSKEHLKFEALELRDRAYTKEVDFGKFKQDKIAQIAQTYQLLNLSTATVNFDDLVYERAIYEESKIDYSLVGKVAFVLALLFAGLYYWNRKLAKLNQMIKLKSQKLTTLLNNAKEGFLTFDTDFIIDDEYSKECEKLLGSNLSGKDIGKLLFVEDAKVEFFKNTLTCALNEKKALAQNAIVSLLPQFIIINKRALQLEYIVIDAQRVMLIITNVSKQQKLEKKVKKEQAVLQMIVAIVSQSDTFYDMKNDFYNFAKNFKSMVDPSKKAPENIAIFYRIVHTFKGIFAQLYMNQSVAKLHALETKLSALQKQKDINNDALLQLLETELSKELLDADLALIEDILGKEFLKQQRFVKIDYGDIKTLQEKISSIMSDDAYQSAACQEIITKIQTLSYDKLSMLLKPYESYVQQLAKRLDKNIYPLCVSGDEEIVVSETYKPFIKSLVHVFRNCVDHGVEDEESRLLQNKDEKATIFCNFSQDDETITIVIGDDGAGIDTQKLQKKLQNKGIDTQSLKQQQLYAYLFEDSFSTKENISDISGRGVGLSAVKCELEKIGGSVEIDSTEYEGTRFEFIIPKG